MATADRGFVLNPGVMLHAAPTFKAQTDKRLQAGASVAIENHCGKNAINGPLWYSMGRFGPDICSHGPAQSTPDDKSAAKAVKPLAGYLSPPSPYFNNEENIVFGRLENSLLWVPIARKVVGGKSEGGKTGQAEYFISFAEREVPPKPVYPPSVISPAIVAAAAGVALALLYFSRSK